MKPCISCGVSKPAEEFRRNSRRSDGRDNRCKECFKAKDAVYRAENPGRIAAIRQKWNAAHPGRAREMFSAWYAEHGHTVRARANEYYHRNRHVALMKMRERRMANPTEWNARIQRSKAKKPLLYAEIGRANRHAYRARKRDVGGKLTAGLAARLFKLQQGKCPCCGRPLGRDYHLDHILPLALGGPNEDWNIQLLRRRCNSQKHAKHPIDFMQQRGFLL